MVGWCIWQAFCFPLKLETIIVMCIYIIETVKKIYINGTYTGQVAVMSFLLFLKRLKEE